MIRILLKREDFETLVSGGVVTGGDVGKEAIEVMLQDIGYDEMVKIIANQMEQP